MLDKLRMAMEGTIQKQHDQMDQLHKSGEMNPDFNGEAIIEAVMDFFDKEGVSTFKVENHEAIIDASKLVWSEGMMPARIVLCKVPAPSLGKGESEYVVWRENLALHGDTWKHRDFYWGHYFGANQEAAHKDFMERASKL